MGFTLKKQIKCGGIGVGEEIVMIEYYRGKVTNRVWTNDIIM